jgi:hypothetical protein
VPGPNGKIREHDIGKTNTGGDNGTAYLLQQFWRIGIVPISLKGPGGPEAKPQPSPAGLGYESR